MLPGSNYVYQCPKCDQLLSKRSLMSGNTFGSIMYSDGKSVSPMMPEFPRLTKCKKCNTLFWIEKAKEVGTYEWHEKENKKWRNVDEAQFLSIYEYFTALKQKIYTSKEEEIFIRIRIWWEFNDRMRNNDKIFNDDADKALWQDNVNNLLSLLNKKDFNEQIMIAELNRNLGNFELCMEIIDSIKDSELNWLVQAFNKECAEKNTAVIQLN
jgi:hypothetical protein